MPTSPGSTPSAVIRSILRDELHVDFYGTYECALYGDARVMAELKLGQLEVVSAVSPLDPLGHPTAFVRFDAPYDATRHDLAPYQWSMDDELFHGGSVDEEVAALLALASGGRFRAGGITRRGDDSRFGSPIEATHVPPVLPVPTSGGPSALRRVTREVYLNEMTEWFERFAALPPDASIVLLRAARSFQLATWYVDDDMSMSWLRLVTAVETAARAWARQTESNVALLTLTQPDLVDALGSFGDAAVELVADAFGPRSRLQASFRRFLTTYLPPAPEPRPPGTLAIPWTTRFMKDAFTTIYRYRSIALHDGRPFPVPMCEPPSYSAAKDGSVVAVAERPQGIATYAMGGTWAAEDTPMTLDTFAFIVRHSLLNWWTDGCPSESA